MTTKDKIRIGMSDIGTSVEKMVENITNNIYFKAGEESQNQKIIEEIEKRIKMYHDKLRGSKFEGASNKRWHILKKELRNLLNSLGEKEQCK